MNVLSLFDGLSGARLALEKNDIKVDTYYASEVDQYSMAVSKYNYPDIIQVGDIVNIDISKLEKIDLLIGGSPCTNLSFAGKREGMIAPSYDRYLELKEEGFDFGKNQSYLFWEYVRILKDLLFNYPDMLFLLENVKMKEEHRDIISSCLGVRPIEINSALLSAQNRKRFYWTNIPGIKQPQDLKIKLKDVVLPDVLPVALHNLYGGFKEKAVRVFETKSPTLRTAAGGGHIPSFVKESFGTTVQGRYKNGLNDLSTKENPHVLTFTERRTEEAKKIRRENQKVGKDFSPRRMKEVVPRVDDKANCITASMTVEHLVLTDKALEYMDRKVADGRTHWEFKHHSDIRDEKAHTVVANFFKGVPYNVFKDWNCIRKFHPTECERLQTIPDQYTSKGTFDKEVKDISNTQRYRMIGNGFTISVIAHILKGLK